jgi:YidC/Oxa1 family membrane protein insertase
MDKLRLYVWIALAGAVYYLYITWQVDYPPPPPPVPSAVSAPTASDALPALPSETPSIATAPLPAPAPTTTAPTVEAATAPPAATAKIIHVVTDVYDIDISSIGGELIRADLTAYPQSKKNPQPVRLFDPTPQSYFAARSGLRAADDRAAPTHQAAFESDAQEYKLADGQDQLAVKLTWTDAQGVTVTKTYTFKRGSYAIDLAYDVQNQSASEWRAASYVQLVRRQAPQETSIFRPDTYSHMGPAAFDGKAYHKLDLTDDEDKVYKGTYTGAWLAAMQHHFVAAAVPTPDATYDYQLNVDSPNSFAFTYRGPLQAVAPGATTQFKETLFVGPKITAQLQPVGSRLDLTVDYGLLTIIADPLFWLLSKVHSFVGNWGWAIILVTVIIKVAFYKLTQASGRSMAKMREMAPRLKALQDRYKDNREELGRATMEFYKREKINPLAGCLPMLVQMPVWMAFYWVLLNGAEMRQAPFLGYLTDLSSPDPYFILPVFLGIVNFVQFKLNPQPTDPVQAKVMLMMPILMTAMMVLFPSGLALYWVTNTLLSIAQQWNINRVVAAEAAKQKS